MKWIAKLIVLSVFLLPLVLIFALTLIVEDEPLLQKRADMTPERIARAKRVFEQNDPRRLSAGSIAQARLDQEDLDLAINYFANQFIDGIAGLKINPGRAIIESTLKLPINPWYRFLNVKVELKETDKLPQIDHMMLGKLWIPGVLATSLIKKYLPLVQPVVNWQTLYDMITKVKFKQGLMIVTYQWQTNIPATLSGALLPTQDQSQIETYQRRLAELTQTGSNSLNLVTLLQPLFQLATERSVNGEAVAENRALILVLAFYVNQKKLNKLIPASKIWPHPSWRIVTLNDRDDFPKHYLISAMLAAYAGTPLADAVGVFKEIEDSHGGSGFSFNDIAADRAGTRMGELAVENERRAKITQRLLANATESDIMPKTADLPEFMPEAEFKRRFGGIEGKSYRIMMEEIERRVAALQINLQGLP
jgi:hypothetical protein